MSAELQGCTEPFVKLGGRYTLRDWGNVHGPLLDSCCALTTETLQRESPALRWVPPAQFAVLTECNTGENGKGVRGTCACVLHDVPDPLAPLFVWSAGGNLRMTEIAQRAPQGIFNY